MSVPFELTPAIYNLDLRNRAAEMIITRFAIEHAAVDIGSGFVGGLIPGGSLVALAGQLAYQAARVYPEMTRKLAVVYGAEPDDFTRNVVRNALIIEAGVDSLVTAVGPDVLGALALDLTNEFGSEFLKEIAGEIVAESSAATALSFIPIVGAVAGAALDAIVGATLTWRVGTIVSAYFQYGDYLGSRRSTYDAVKPLVARSAKTSRPGTLTAVRKNVDPIREKQVRFAAEHFKSQRLPKDEIRRMLIEDLGVPEDVVDEAYRQSP